MMTLVVMAAGMGSRFGGSKQTAGVGPNGETLLEYAVYDARLAGFDRVVFIIKEEMEQTFRETVGARVSRILPVEYAFQKLEDMPEGFALPPERVKPWGTAHAVRACRHIVDEPFAVINADDFYGRDSFVQLAAFLRQPQTGSVHRIAMAGYLLCNTMTENGSVSRGVCETDADGKLISLTERTCIERMPDGTPAYTEDDGNSYVQLNPLALVSMNCWAFPSGVLPLFERYFADFLRTLSNPLKGEWYLPFLVNALVEDGLATVQVLPTAARWYGMTYAADRQAVSDALAQMVQSGEYPLSLC